MPEVGDRVEVPSKRVGQAPRQGVVTAVSGALLRVAWTTGEESTVMPSMGSLVVVGRGKVPARPGAKAATAGTRSPRRDRVTAGSASVATARSGATGAAKKSAAKKSAAGTKQSRSATAHGGRPAPEKTGKAPARKGAKATAKKRVQAKRKR